MLSTSNCHSSIDEAEVIRIIYTLSRCILHLSLSCYGRSHGYNMQCGKSEFEQVMTTKTFYHSVDDNDFTKPQRHWSMVDTCSSIIQPKDATMLWDLWHDSWVDICLNDWTLYFQQKLEFQAMIETQKLELICKFLDRTSQK